MIFHILSDCADEFAHIAKAASADALVRQLPKPPFDHVQPGTRCRDEMQVKARMPSQPRFDTGVLVGPVIIDDQMQVEMGWCLGVNLFEEPNELLMPMPGHAVADDFPVKHVQRCKQGGRTVSFVVVRHGSAAPLLHWQAGLGPIKSLNLAFLVYGENQGLVRGIEVESDNIIELFDELLVVADLKGSDKMGLETVLSPDAAYCGLADSLCLCHEACAPMGRIGRLGMQSGFDDRTDFALRNARNATGARSILFKPSHSQGEESLPPQLDSRPRDIQLLCDLLIRDAVSGHLNDSCALHEANRQACCACPRSQLGPLLRRKHYWWGQMHNTYHSDHLFNCQVTYDSLQ